MFNFLNSNEFSFINSTSDLIQYPLMAKIGLNLKGGGGLFKSGIPPQQFIQIGFITSLSYNKPIFHFYA